MTVWNLFESLARSADLGGVARVAFATGDMQRTIALLEQARGHRYKGQSGPVLALLGEAYEEESRTPAAPTQEPCR